MQGGERVGLFAPISAPPEGSQGPVCHAGHNRESEQYPDENESVYHQIADVVLMAGNPLVQGHQSLISHLREQSLGRVGVWGSHHYRHEGTAALYQIATRYSPEIDFRGIPGGNLVKRSGPLVAVVVAPPDPDAAERLLAQVRYQALVTLDQWVPSHKDNIGNLVINAFILDRKSTRLNSSH